MDPALLEQRDLCKQSMGLHMNGWARAMTPYQCRKYTELPYRGMQAVNGSKELRGLLQYIAQSTEAANKIFGQLFLCTNGKEGSVLKVLIDFDIRNLGGLMSGYW
eukprot:244315_1